MLFVTFAHRLSLQGVSQPTGNTKVKHMELVLDYASFWKPALTVLVTWLIGIGIKTLLQYRVGQHLHPFRDGGMPSTHTAFVVGLAIVLLLETGLSMTFLLAVGLACIVISDAHGVRWEVSRHSKALNHLVQKNRYKVVGHRVIEVIVGALLGIFLPIIFYSFL